MTILSILNIARIVAAAMLLAAMLPTAACAAAPPADLRYASLDGHRIAYRVLGSGGPVIVLLSGLGYGMDTFSGVAGELAAHATVIVYDRGGYGRSEPAAAVRSAAEAERELLAVLREAGVQGPVYLLGHSLGGTFAEYFAARHPNLIAGLILEESRPAGFGAACRERGLSMCAPPAAMAMFMPQGGRAEMAALEQTMSQVAAVTPADVPALVLARSVAARPNAMDALWAAAQADLAARYPRARFVTAPRGGHDLHHEARDWFLQQVIAFTAATPAGA
jgi:pimeloyl-ACP methyl ester carboxylesterase